MIEKVGKIEWYDGNERKHVADLIERQEEEELPEHMEGELIVSFSSTIKFDKPLQTRMIVMQMYAEQYAKTFQN